MATDEFIVLGVNQMLDPNRLDFTSAYIFNGKKFKILVSQTPPSGYDNEDAGALEYDYLYRLEEVSMHPGTDPEDNERQDKCLEKVGDEIGEIVRPMLKKFAPSMSGRPYSPSQKWEVRTVQQHVHPDEVKLQLVTLNGELTLIEGHHSNTTDKVVPVTAEELKKVIPDLDSLPVFQASQVYMGRPYFTGMSAFEASIEGEKYVCKVAWKFLRNTIIPEVETLLKIQKANLDSEARTSRLKGLITLDGGYVGFVLNNIPAKIPALGDVIERHRVEASLPRRRKWAAQIEHTITELHRNGIIWKDAKPDNVVIDENDDAWVIDFGGGFTDTWVDVELSESREGDLQGLGRIKEALEKEYHVNGEDGRRPDMTGQDSQLEVSALK
ncbi:hypothetical protein F4781DRAFT_4359 [Annulohypoxylon bovei var. microspora]|nr:hypothetical protein F4781DRAFT_4359 [Annulohypoxylon bovei var. microspora]